MKKVFKTISLLFTVALLSSCLKSNDLIGPNAANSAGAIIEFDNIDFIASGSSSATVFLARYDETITPKTATSKLVLRVNYAGTGKPAPSDVTVNLTTDAAALTLHNTQAGKSFTAIPAAWFTLPASVVIPAGQNVVEVPVTINMTNFVAGSTYALAFKIASASSGTISGNFGTIVVSVK